MTTLLTPNPLWILYTYLAGIFVVWLIGAARFGAALAPTPPPTTEFTTPDIQRAFCLVEAALKPPFNNAFQFDYHRKQLNWDRAKELAKILPDAVEPPDVRKAVNGLWIPILVGLFWPIAGPLFLAFHHGTHKALKLKQTQNLLVQANAEIDRIRAQEGWMK